MSARKSARAHRWHPWNDAWLRVATGSFAESGDEVISSIDTMFLSEILSVSPSGFGVGVPDLSGPEWVEGAEPLEVTRQISLSGDLGFDGEVGGFHCVNADMDATLYQEGFGAEITSVALENCETTGWLHQSGCRFTSPPEGMVPWNLNLLFLGAARISNLEISVETGGEACAFGLSRPYGVQGEMSLTADDAIEISEFTPGGEFESTVGIVQAKSNNGLDVTPAGVYGIK